MPGQDALDEVFEQLRGIFSPYESQLVIMTDRPGNLQLYTPASSKYRRGLFFGAVQINKRYVSYHLMPVYVYPDLLDGLSASLRKRMHGKSCFNFTALDESTMRDLTRLTRAGFERFKLEELV